MDIYKKLLASFCAILMIIACSSAMAISYADYPYSQPAGTYVIDAWKFFQCECTSYVAWCLNNRNGISFHNLYKPGTGERLPDSIYNYDIDGTIYYGKWGHANNWKNAAEQLGYRVDRTPAPGAIYWYWNGQTSSTGHVAWVSEVRPGNKVVIEQYNGGLVLINGKYYGNHQFSAEEFVAGSKGEYYIHIKDLGDSERHDEAMSQGFDRVLPDGDYLIAAAGTSDKRAFYYLDIVGTAQPAANDTNVALHGPLSENPPAYEIWTITYNSSDKFYTIRQKGTNMCLDVYCGNSLQGSNVQVYSSNGNDAQKWAIERNGSNGYRLRPKCSGGGSTPMCLDIENGTIASGTNVRQWAINNSDAQSWLFIPYNPSQPIAEGRYILLYTTNTSYELDVPGNTGSIDENTNIQLWNDGALSQFNSFDFIKLANGYYKVKHAASGKCLDVTGGLSSYKTNVALHTDNDTIAQQWAVVSNGAGYSLISRCNGYALDLPGGITGDEKNVEVYPRLGNNNQRWSFVQAEYTVQYDANGGTGAPANQTKYYKAALPLSADEPIRDGYIFQGWAASASAAIPEYQPGGNYTEDKDVTLFALWTDPSANVVASGTCGDHAVWTLDANGLLTISGTGPMGNYDLPDPSHPFYAIRNDVRSVVIENGITWIGEGAFARLDNLISVIIPDSVTGIGDLGFCECRQLSDIVLPDTVTLIGASSFESCEALTSINIPANISSICWGAFIGCYNLKHLTLPENTPTKDFIRCYEGDVCDVYLFELPASLQWLDDCAFAQTDAGELLMHISPDFVLPQYLKTVEAEAFAEINATCVHINSQMAIESKAFANCKQLRYVVFTEDGGYGYQLNLADDAFEGCENLIIFATPGYSYGAVKRFAVEHGYQYYKIEGL